MFGLFKRRSDDGPSLDSIRFDTTGYEYQGEPQPGEVRVWYTPQGDGLGLYFFPIPPNLPTNASTVAEMAVFYRTLIGESDAKLVEVALVSAGGCSVIRTLLSVPQEPTGRTCVGSLTVPFRNFSFVLKCQCRETGPTGLKAAVLLDRCLEANEPMTVSEDGKFHIPGFDLDDPKHDAEFPDDPVARCRRVLDHLTKSLDVTESVKRLPGFLLPHTP